MPISGGTYMTLPRVYGQGQLFAFSALDGDSFSSDDLAGYLSGDRIGIIFCLKERRELAFCGIRGGSTEFATVTGDYLDVVDTCKVLFVKRNIVIGEVYGEVRPAVFCEGRVKTGSVCAMPDTEEPGDSTEWSSTDSTGCLRSISIEMHYNDADEYTGLAVIGNRYAFVYGHSQEELLSLVREAFRMDMHAEEEKKLAFYRRFGALTGRGQMDGMPYARQYPALYAKCLSVMKTQLYSPESEYSMIRSTPDRLPHKKLWLWDSVFHAAGFRHLDTSLAEDLIRAVFVHQRTDGFIPHMSDLGSGSGITQPPIIAWGAWKVYEKAADKSRSFLEEIYKNNARFLDWYHVNRRLDTDTFLYTWNLTDDVNCRCDESGMDNSPRFDGHDPLYAIDLSCFMANDVRVMARIAHELGYTADELRYNEWYDRISLDINRILWSEEDGFYFDYNTNCKKLSKVWSVASFLPIFAEVCSRKRREALLFHLTDPHSFGTAFPIPSISLKDPTYGSDMWRGPVWINYNYMIIDGLRRCFGTLSHAENGIAGYITEKTLSVINKWYNETGCIFEFYDSSDRVPPMRLNRKGPAFEPYNFDVRYQTIRDYGWSTTLAFDLLN